MKIIHVAHCYHPSKGGVQWFFKNVSERLVKDYGDDVTVVTTNSMYGPERLLFERLEPKEEIINGVRVIRFPYSRLHIRPLRYFIKGLRKLSIPVPEIVSTKLYGPLSKEMKQYLLNNNADAILASSSNYYYMQLPTWKECNFFYFGSIHLPESASHKAITDIQKRSIEASKLYIANTEFEKQRLIEAGIGPDKIKVIGVGVDETLFDIGHEEISNYRQSLNIPTGSVVIGYVGRIEKTKNIKLLVDAFIRLATNHNDIYLIIAGAGSEYARELQAYCQQLEAKIANRIIWKIDFSTGEKAPLFHSIDILVLPSNNESFGIVFLEAWVCKKPVIGSDIGAVRNVISAEKDGLLIKPDDVESLCNSLISLVSNPTRRLAMGTAGYDKVMEHYTWDIITSKLRNCYLGRYNSN